MVISPSAFRTIFPRLTIIVFPIIFWNRNSTSDNICIGNTWADLLVIGSLFVYRLLFGLNVFNFALFHNMCFLFVCCTFVPAKGALNSQASPILAVIGDYTDHVLTM